MAGNMHVPAGRPACHTTGPATPRSGWAFDQGRGCGNAADADTWARTLHHTPGCAGCRRATHALAIRAGLERPLPKAGAKR